MRKLPSAREAVASRSEGAVSASPRAHRVKNGAENIKAKLTEADAIAIYLDRTTLQVELAKKYGISQGSVSSIHHSRTWDHITSKIRPEDQPNKRRFVGDPMPRRKGDSPI